MSDPDSAVNLPGGNTVLATGLHPDSHEPLIETECGVFHDGANLDAELRLGVTAPTLPQAAGSDIPNVLRSAGGTHNSVLPFPAVRHEVADAIVGIVEVYNRLPECLWFALYFAHTSTLTEKA